MCSFRILLLPPIPIRQFWLWNVSIRYEADVAHETYGRKSLASSLVEAEMQLSTIWPFLLVSSYHGNSTAVSNGKIKKGTCFLRITEAVQRLSLPPRRNVCVLFHFNIPQIGVPGDRVSVVKNNNGLMPLTELDYLDPYQSSSILIWFLNWTSLVTIMDDLCWKRGGRYLMALLNL